MAVAALLLGGGFFAASTALAQTAVTWSATSNSTWATTGSWTLGALPRNSLTLDYASFNSTGVTVTTGTTQSVAGINFGSSAGAYTLTNPSGFARTLTLGAYGIRSASANDQLITGASSRITLGAASSFLVNGSGNLTISTSNSSIATTAANTLTLGGTGSGLGTISSVISGGGNVTNSGSATWNLSGTNTYTGNSTLTSGTLVAANTRALGATTAPLWLNGGTLDLNIGSSISAYNTTVTANSTVMSDLAAGGAGITHTLGTLSIGTQTLNVAAGTNVTSGTAGLTFGATTLTGNATFDVGTSAQLQLGALAGGGVARTITKADVGTLIFGTNASSVTAGSSLLVNGGIAQVNTATALGTGAVNVTVNSTTASGTAAFNLNNVSQTIGTLTFGGAGAGASATNSVATGTGTLTLAGNLAYVATKDPGDATLSGRLALGANRVFTIDDSANSTKELAISAIISGATFGINKQGAGTLELSGVNTYSGVTTVTAGTLRAITSTAALGAGTLTLAGGTLGLADNTGLNFARNTTVTSNSTVTSDRLSASGNITNTLGTLSIGAQTLNVNAGPVITANGGTAGLTFGATSLTASGATFAPAAGTLLTLGAISGNTNSFTVNGAGDAAITGAITTTTGGVTKSGIGNLTLSGTNTYTGTTTINGGTVIATNNASLGALPGGAVNISGGGTLDIGGNPTSNNANLGAKQFNIAGTGVGGNGAIVNTGVSQINAFQNITLAGDATIGGSARYDVRGGAANLDLAGYTLTKTGSNQISVVGGNITDGNIVVNQGEFAVQTSTNAVAGTGSITFNSGTTLGLWANTGTVTRDIILNGANVLNESGTSVVGSNITLGGDSTVDVNSGSALTLNGNLSQTGGARGLTLTDTGNLTFAGGGSNTYTGTTTVNGGTLFLAKTGGAIAMAGNLSIGDGAGIDTVQLNAANQIVSTAAVTFNNSGGTPTLNLNGYSQTLGSIASTNTAAAIQLGSPGSATTLTVGDSTSTQFNGVISGGANAAFVKTGSGTLTLAGSSTYSGDTTVSAGTLAAASNSALGAATGNVTVSSGGTLALGGGTTITKTGLLTLTGTGAAGANGALQAAGGTGTTSQFSGNLTLAGNTTIGAANNLLIVGEGSTFTNTINLGSNTLTLNTTAAVDGSTPTPTFVPGGYTLDKAQIMVNSAISGTGGLIKTGPGTAMLIPANVNGSTFTGDTVITGGKLIVDGPINKPGIASNNIYVGNASSPGAANSVVLQMGQLATLPADSNMVGVWNNTTDSSASNLTIYADGVFNMNNASNGFTSLKLTGGHVNGNGITPLITLGNGGVTTNVLTTNASNQTAIIEGGRLGLATFGNSNFTVAAGTAPGGVDLRIDDVLQQGSLFTGYTDTNTSLTKLGAGKLVLTASNMYHGVTDVSAGILNIQNNAALGAVAPSLGNTANGTLVRSGAQLQLEKTAGLTIGRETLTLNGTGISGDGALRNVAGNNTYNGYVYLGSDSRINADSGTTLTIANTNGVNAAIMNGTGTGMNLTVGGAGNTTVNGGISSFVNNVTKDGTGTLTLAGNNGYAGTTSVTQGAVKVTNSSGLSGTGVTVSSGAALQFAQDAGNANITVSSVGATLNGMGLSNGGAIENLNGNNAYLGAITVGAAAARINADAASSLTLSGGISGSGSGLTLGGSGNTTISGNVGLGTGTLTKDGSGTATLSGGTTAIGNLTMSAGTFNVSSASTNTGTVTVNAGTATFSGNATNTGAVTVNTGTLNFNGTNATTGQVHLLGGATSTIAVGSGATVTTGEFDSAALTTLSIASGGAVVSTYAAGNTIIAGQMTDNGTFTGKFNSTGNTFTGGINGASTGTFKILSDSSGQLIFNQSIAASGLTVFIGGDALQAGAWTSVLTLTITGNSTLLFGTLHITGDTILDFGNSSASVLNSANLIIDAGVKVSVINWISLTDAWYATSSFTQQGGPAAVLDAKGAAPENQITYTGWGAANTSWVTPQGGQYKDHEIRPVPEPATYGVILLSGCLALLGFRRYRRAAAGRR